MSKFKKVRFCDKCLTSIPIGDVYYERGDKEICSKCNKKGTVLRVATALLVFGLCFYTGLKSYTGFDGRIESNTQRVEAVAEYAYELNGRVARTFREVGNWADVMEQTINQLYSSHKENVALLQMTVNSLKAELDDIMNAQEAIRSDLNNGKLTDKQAHTILVSLLQRVKSLDSQVQTLDRSPQEIMDKLIKPTVGIAVRDVKGDRLRGSGVLFKRVAFKDKKGRTMYRYYGFTAYHVWHGILKYIEDNKSNASNKNLNPKLLIQYYGGNSERPVEFKEATPVFPNKPSEAYVSQQDILVFTFVHYNDKLALAELATDAEITKNIQTGHRIFTTGIAIHGAPTLYTGSVANPKVSKNMGVAYHAFAYYGMSGGPTFDAVTLKVVGVNQRVHVHPVLGGADGVPNTNLLYGHHLKSLRMLWKLSAPKEAKNLLDP